MKSAAIGIDLGGTNTAIGLVSQTGEIIVQTNFRTDASNSFEQYYTQLVKQLRPLLKTAHVVGIGIGAPTGNRHQGTINSPANLAWQGTYPIAKLLQADLQCAVQVDNDANIALLGELQYGAAQGMQHVVLITLGTGLGSGILVGGDVLIGAHGYAGELGHIAVEPHGRQCACGKQGCLETYASAAGLKRTVLELKAQTQINSCLDAVGWDSFSAEDVYMAAQKNDLLALRAFAFTGEILGRALANFAAFSDPEAFVLFGGLANAGNLLLDPAQKAFEENLLFLYKKKTKLVLSALMDKNAALLGAAALAWQANKHQ